MSNDPKDKAKVEPKESNPHFGGGKSDFARQLHWDVRAEGEDKKAGKDKR